MANWIIQNTFLSTEKYSWQAEALAAAARGSGIDLKIIGNADALFCWDGHGAHMLPGRDAPGFVIALDKDIPLLRALEASGARVFNSADAVELCDDKMKTHMRLSRAGVPMPRTIPAPMTYSNIGYSDFSFLRPIVGALGLPLVVKERCGSFGQQVHLAKSKAETEAILRAAGGPVLFQEYIAESSGRDLRLYMVGDRCPASMERFSLSGDFRASVSQGGEARRHIPTEGEMKIARACMSALGLDFAGVDILFGKDGPLLCEVNSSAHFKSALLYTGIDISGDIVAHAARQTGLPV